MRRLLIQNWRAPSFPDWSLYASRTPKRRRTTCSPWAVFARQTSVYSSGRPLFTGHQRRGLASVPLKCSSRRSPRCSVTSCVNRSLHLDLQRPLRLAAEQPAVAVRVDRLDGDVELGRLQVVRQLRAHERRVQAHVARREEHHVLPDAGVAVADAVAEREVPPDAHQHRDVASDQPVAAVGVLHHPLRPPLARVAGDVERIHFHGQRVARARIGEEAHVHRLAREHAGRKRHHLAVEPDLRTVVDSLGTQPDAAALPVRRQVELGAEPRRVVRAVAVPEVGDELVRLAVVEPPVGLRKLAVPHQVVEHGSRHLRGHPRGGVESGNGHLLARERERVRAVQHPPSLARHDVRRRRPANGQQHRAHAAGYDLQYVLHVIPHFFFETSGQGEISSWRKA